MRLYLLPVSTRRTLLYSQRLNVTTVTQENTGYLDRAVGKATKKWADWEKQKSGWKRKVVDYGNYAFRRIPFEEWGLKSVPPLSARRKADEIQGKETVDVVFPQGEISPTKAEGILKKLATERQALHRQRLIWCFIGMPISAPFALIPVIPNLPFFYLVYRAWSHWRALSGGKHIQWLIENKLLSLSPSPTLESLYRKSEVVTESAKEQLLLTKEQVQDFSQALDVPALEIELERAIWQVEKSIEEVAKSPEVATQVSEKKDQ